MTHDSKIQHSMHISDFCDESTAEMVDPSLTILKFMTYLRASIQAAVRRITNSII